MVKLVRKRTMHKLDISLHLSFHFINLVFFGFAKYDLIMKFIKRIVFFILFSYSFIGSTQSADEVISNYINYIGGVQKWKSVNTITSTGTYN